MCVRRLEHALLPACALACAHAYVDCGSDTHTALARHALSCVTGYASLADTKTRRVDLVEKETMKPAIARERGDRTVQRPRAAQHAHTGAAPIEPPGIGVRR